MRRVMAGGLWRDAMAAAALALLAVLALHGAASACAARTGGSVDMVLGMAEGLNVADVMPFVRTLKASPPPAEAPRREVALFAETHDPRVAAFLAAEGVAYVPFAREGGPSSWAVRTHVANYRMRLFAEHLAARGAGVRHAVLLDVSDIIFQVRARSAGGPCPEATLALFLCPPWT